MKITEKVGFLKTTEGTALSMAYEKAFDEYTTICKKGNRTPISIKKNECYDHTHISFIFENMNKAQKEISKLFLGEDQAVVSQKYEDAKGDFFKGTYNEILTFIDRTKEKRDSKADFSRDDLNFYAMHIGNSLSHNLEQEIGWTARELLNRRLIGEHGTAKGRWGFRE